MRQLTRWAARVMLTVWAVGILYGALLFPVHPHSALWPFWHRHTNLLVLVVGVVSYIVVFVGVIVLAWATLVFLVRHAQ